MAPESAVRGVAQDHVASTTTEEGRQKLINDFRSLVEEPVILAISSEYDLDTARLVLGQIAETVPEEEASGFDPSGLGSQRQTADIYDGSGANSYGPSGLRQRKLVADLAGLELNPFPNVANTDSSAPRTSDSEQATMETCLSDTSEGWWQPIAEDGKGDDVEEHLRELFPDLKEIDISSALKSAAGDPGRAFDELETIRYLENSGQRQKGIDAFFAPDGQAPKKQRGNLSREASKKARANLVLNYSIAPSSDHEEFEDGITKAPPRRPVVRSSTNASNQPVLPVSAGAAASTSLPPAGPADWRTVTRRRQAEDARRTRQEEKDTADSLVDSQSSQYVVDLHGVSVQDGVRIARERAWGWWDGLGEERVRRAKLDSLVIVTGMGKHSSNGVSRMRQEVSAVLKREGWKVTTETAQFRLTGRL